MARLSLTKRLIFGGILSAGLWLMAEAAATTFYRAELLAWESPPASAQKGVPVMQGNPYLLYEYPPGSHQERGVTVDINKLGLRGPDLEIPKPSGLVRMMSTGDSSIFGFGVEYDETFTTVAAARLNASGSIPKVEPVIAATPGYSTLQSINLLNLRALQADPDLLVIANLWSDNNFDSFVDKEVLAETTGFQSSWAGSLRSLLSRSAVFRVVDWRLRVKGSVQRVRDVGWMQSGRPQLGPRRVEINDYASNLDTLVDMAKDRDAGVVFVLPANNEDMLGGPGEKAWDPYRQVMRDTAARHGAPVVDVPEVFKASGLPRDQLFLDEMHPTALGHRLMGEALAQALQDRGWPGQPVNRDGTGGSIPTYEDPFTQGSAAAAGPGGAGAPGGQAGTGASITGVLRCKDCTSGVIILEALRPGGGSNPTVVGQVQIPAGSTDFALAIGRVDAVVLRAYLDKDGDGPTAGDTLYDLTATPLELGEGGRSGVLIDLDERSVKP